MRIIIISTVAFAPNGITSMIMNNYRYLDKEKIHCDFIAIQPETKPLSEHESEIHKNGSKLFLLTRIKGTKKYFFSLLSLLKQGNYDAAHIHGSSASLALDLLAAKLAGIKVRIAHSHNTTCNKRNLHELLYPVFNLLVTHRVACSQKAGRWLFRNKQFLTLKNGVVLDRYYFSENARQKTREELGCGEKLVIGHIGVFNEQKNHRFLIDIFSTIKTNNPDSVLLLIGDGKLREEIQKTIKDKGLQDNTIIIERTYEIPKYLVAMDVFVLPSLFEGFPVVGVEAQAADLPCVFSDTISDDINITGNVQFVSLEDRDEWIRVISNAKKERRDSNRTFAMLRKQGYDIKENAKILENYYLTACS